MALTNKRLASDLRKAIPIDRTGTRFFSDLLEDLSNNMTSQVKSFRAVCPDVLTACIYGAL